MTIGYSLTKDLRLKLKEPFGLLIRGSLAETMKELEKLIKKRDQQVIISVGDVVSQSLHVWQLTPLLTITDNKCMREKTETKLFPGKNLIYVSNPQGTITEEAIAAIKEALKNDTLTQIVVDGEEDLLALVAVIYAKEESLVVYGQPHEGIVVVEVTPQKKAEAKTILKAMKTVRKAK